MSIPIATASAAEKQIDQIQNLLNAIVLAAVVIILADAAAEKDVSFLGLKTETSSAYGIAACAFFLAMPMIAQLFARLADMVVLCWLMATKPPSYLLRCSIIAGLSIHFPILDRGR